jgi:hypothetical protein
MRFPFLAAVRPEQFSPARVFRTGDVLLVRRNFGLGGVLVSFEDGEVELYFLFGLFFH